MPQAVLVAAARTPIGRARKGSLVDCRPDDLAVTAVRAVLDKVPELPAGDIDDIVLGCAQPSGEHGHNLARAVAVLLGLTNVPGVTVNRFCSSSLQAIRMAAHAVRAGEGDAFVCAGVEAVSRYNFGPGDGAASHNPFFAGAEERSRERTGGADSWEPAAGLPDIYIAMGQTAENVRLKERLSRQEMDEFAALSQNRAVGSQENGTFEREVLATLKPAFRPDGEVTAGNSCPLNDGAAAVIVMSDTKAAELGITPLARILSSGVSGLDPEIMGLGPVDACRQALKRAGLTIDDVDLVEINEAFAAQVIPSARHLGIAWDKLNVNGGAIALGHPFGMTGARIMTTLLNALEERDLTIGLESMCVGGGQGMAMVIERLR